MAGAVRSQSEVLSGFGAAGSEKKQVLFNLFKHRLKECEGEAMKSHLPFECSGLMNRR